MKICRPQQGRSIRKRRCSLKLPASAPALDYYAVQEEPPAAVQEPVQESSGNPDPDLSNYLSQEYDGR